MSEMDDLHASLDGARSESDRRRMLLENLSAAVIDLKHVNWKIQASRLCRPGENTQLLRYTQIIEGKLARMDGLMRLLLAQEDEQLLARYLAEFMDPPPGEGE